MLLLVAKRNDLHIDLIALHQRGNTDDEFGSKSTANPYYHQTSLDWDSTHVHRRAGDQAPGAKSLQLSLKILGESNNPTEIDLQCTTSSLRSLIDDRWYAESFGPLTGNFAVSLLCLHACSMLTCLCSLLTLRLPLCDQLLTTSSYLERKARVASSYCVSMRVPAV